MTEQKELPQLTNAQMRDYIIRAHGLATGNYVQDDTEMRRRVGALLEKAIQEDAVLAGFLGRGGPCADRDILAGNTCLDDAQPAELKGETNERVIEFGNNMAMTLRAAVQPAAPKGRSLNEIADMGTIGEPAANTPTDLAADMKTVDSLLNKVAEARVKSDYPTYGEVNECRNAIRRIVAAAASTEAQGER